MAFQIPGGYIPNSFWEQILGDREVDQRAVLIFLGEHHIIVCLPGRL